MKFLRYSLLLISPFLWSVINAQEIESKWVKKAVNLDGNPEEWEQPFVYYDGVTRLQFSITNDTGSLYLCLLVNDDRTQMRLFKGGLNIWLDPKGKKKETVGLTFPLRHEHKKTEPADEQQSEDQPGMHKWGQSGIVNKLKERELVQQNTMSVHGFTGITEEIIPLKNNYGVTAALGWDTLGILCLEYKIPLQQILHHPLSDKDTLSLLQIGFIEPGIDVASKGNGDKQNGEEHDRYSDMSGQNSGMGSFNNGNLMNNQGGFGTPGYGNTNPGAPDGSYNNGGYGSSGYGNGGYQQMQAPGQTSNLSQDAKSWSKLRLAYGR